MICIEKNCTKEVPTTVRKYIKDGKEIDSVWSFKTCTEHRPSRKMPLGTKKKTSGGYILMKTTRGWKAEHTIVMEGIIGRELIKGESVHHKDGDKENNSPNNLELWVGTIRYGQRAADIICPHCTRPYFKPA